MADKNNDGSVDLKQIEQEYKKLLNDPKFEKLEAELRKPNIFSILGIGRMEIRHSNFLAWLLDPNGSHGLGNRFLIRVLRDLATQESKKNELDIFKINELNFSNVEVSREVPINLKDKNCRIDILIIFRDEDNKHVICIENKIDTTDSKGQLKKYRDYVNDTFDEFKKTYVYLTPKGTDPDDSNEAGEWDPYSYEKIVTHMENIQNATVNSTIKTYISDYLITLKREIMGANDLATEIANEIYTNNREIFQFIIDNISDEVIKAIWDDEDKKRFKEEGEKILEILKREDQDKTIKYELGFAKNYISIKRDGKRIYSLWPRKKPNYALDIDFASSENKDSIKKTIIEILGEVKNSNKKRVLKLSDSKNYITINNADLLSGDNFEIIHNKIWNN